MHRFYSSLIENNKAVLLNDEAHHAQKVLRLNVGDEIEVFDGKGTNAIANLSSISKKEVQLEIKTEVEGWDKNLNLPSIAIAPTKNINRLEWFVEKATEIGVSNIYPILCKRSERKILRIDRLEKLILSATKQNKRSILPKIFELQPFENFITKNRFEQSYVGYCDEDTVKISPSINSKQTTCFLIGPEGDFTPNEIKLAIENQFQPITFGESRLRTETAAIFACAMFQNAKK